jgi:integrase
MASIFRQRYTAKGKDGKRVRKQSQFWYIDYKDADGIRKRVKGFKDKAATVQLAAQLERETEQAQVGIVDRYKEHRKRPLSAHLDDYRASLMNKGTTEKHAYLVYNRAKAVIDACGFAFVGDISASKVQAYLAERRQEKPKQRAIGIRTSNFFLQSLKQFSRWLVADGRTGENPLAYLQGQNPKTDIRHRRRALSSNEIERLIEATARGPARNGMSSKERVMLYSLALTSGLRASELASLTWQCFDFEGSPPTVRVEACYSKHRREDIQPLPADVAEGFRRWQCEIQPGPQDCVFGTFNKNNASRMLKKDLAAAEIPYTDSADRTCDFHALRATYITHIVKGGASPKIAQHLARHSSISLTFDVYTHIGLHDAQGALSALPHIPCIAGDGNQQEDREALRTGTDDQPVEGAYKPAYKKLTETPYSSSAPMAMDGTAETLSDGNPGRTASSDKSLEMAHLDNSCHLSTRSESERSGFEPEVGVNPLRRFSKPLP